MGLLPAARAPGRGCPWRRRRLRRSSTARASSGRGATARIRQLEDCEPHQAGISTIKRRYSTEHIFRTAATTRSCSGSSRATRSSRHEHQRPGARRRPRRTLTTESTPRVDDVMRGPAGSACASGSATDCSATAPRPPSTTRALRRGRAHAARRRRRRLRTRSLLLPELLGDPETWRLADGDALRLAPRHGRGWRHHVLQAPGAHADRSAGCSSTTATTSSASDG